MSNTAIIKSEIKELHECINVIYYNLGRIDMGSVSHDAIDQESRKDRHFARIAELEKKLSDIEKDEQPSSYARPSYRFGI